METKRKPRRFMTIMGPSGKPVTCYDKSPEEIKKMQDYWKAKFPKYKQLMELLEKEDEKCEDEEEE
jgi:hypothetical protein